MKYEIVREGGVKKRNALYGCNLNLEKIMSRASGVE